MSNYPASPSYRMAYDRDGTAGVWYDGNLVAHDLTPETLRRLNNERDDQGLGSGTSGYVALVFPQKRRLAGLFLSIATYYQSSSNYTSPRTSLPVEVSTDTTNGLDGTWSALSPDPLTGSAQKAASNWDPTNQNLGFVNGGVGGAVAPFYRRRQNVSGANNGILDLTGPSVANVKGIRFRVTAGYLHYSNQWSAIHLYGFIEAGQAPDRLAFWHPTLDQEVPADWLDWGDVPVGSSADRQVRVKNLSPTLTANDVQVSLEALSDATPSVVGAHSLSSDGTTFGPVLALGMLTPGAVSGLVTVRRATPSNAQLSVWSARLVADVSTWS